MISIPLNAYCELRQTIHKCLTLIPTGQIVVTPELDQLFQFRFAHSISESNILQWFHQIQRFTQTTAQFRDDIIRVINFEWSHRGLLKSIRSWARAPVLVRIKFGHWCCCIEHLVHEICNHSHQDGENSETLHSHFRAEKTDSTETTIKFTTTLSWLLRLSTWLATK